jgi:DNA polymerase III subunit alpha
LIIDKRKNRTVGKMMSVAHLHTYSAYSLLSSTITPENLVREAKKKGFQSIALTDRNVLYGVIPFYKASKNAGMKPIIGLTADVLKDDNPESTGFPLILLAKNYNGYKNLMKISSSIQTKSKNGIPPKWLKAYSKGLIAISPGIEGEIEQLILNNEIEAAVEKIVYFKHLFEERSFYLSVQPFPYQDNIMLTNQVGEMSKQLQVPLVATNPVSFNDKEDYFAWKCLLAINKNVKVEDLAETKVEHEYYLKSKEEMFTQFRDFPEALENTMKIAAQCSVEIPLHQQLLPKYPLNNITSDDYLTEICNRGLNEKVPDPSDIYKERLAYELSVIKNMKYSDYFLIVWDYVHFARNNGITVGPGRGSAAGSLVAFSLGITEVDPIKFNLLFERFLNPERVSMPDIDIDFPDHRRDEVIEYVVKKYGANHVSQIITFGTFAAKASLRDVARVFGLTSKEIDQFSKSIPNKLGITLKDALKISETLRDLVAQEKMKRIYDIACKIEGLPRHSSTHAAGVVISDTPLVEHVPLQQGSGEV